MAPPSAPKLLGFVPGTHTRDHHKSSGRFCKDGVIEKYDITKAASVHKDQWILVEKQELIEPNAYESSISFKVNGEEHTVVDVDPEAKLANFLRFHLGLTGTKIGCGEGGCGACSVVIKFPGERPVRANSCMRPVASLDGASVTTTEGLGGAGGAGYHAIQEKLAECDGSQCGYCSPGMVMAMYGMLARDANPSAEEVEGAIQGNICRCTGYRPILAAWRSLAEDGACVDDAPDVATTQIAPRPRSSKIVQSGGTKTGSTVWYNPSSLDEVFALLGAAKDAGRVAKLVCGNTSIGVAKYYSFAAEYDAPSVFVNVARLPELTQIAVDAEKGVMTVGSSVTLTNLIEALEAQKSANLGVLAAHLRKVAHYQVRDVGSWAGNVMLAKSHPDFPSDVGLLLTCVNASLELATSGGATSHVDAEAFWRAPFDPTTTVLRSVTLPLLASRSEVLTSFKVMKRHVNTHADVNAAVLLRMSETAPATIASARVVFGNQPNAEGSDDTAGYTVCAKTAAMLAGRALDASTFAAVAATLRAELEERPYGSPPPRRRPGDGSAPLRGDGNAALLTHLVEDAGARRSLALQLLYKALLASVLRVGGELEPALLSAAVPPVHAHVVRVQSHAPPLC